jgi:hypothetical protein
LTSKDVPKRFDFKIPAFDDERLGLIFKDFEKCLPFQVNDPQTIIEIAFDKKSHYLS